jgi:hypothetical protein
VHANVTRMEMHRHVGTLMHIRTLYLILETETQRLAGYGRRIHRDPLHYDSYIYIRSKNIPMLCRRAPPGISSENNILMYVRGVLSTPPLPAPPRPSSTLQSASPRHSSPLLATPRRSSPLLAAPRLSSPVHPPRYPFPFAHCMYTYIQAHAHYPRDFTHRSLSSVLSLSFLCVPRLHLALSLSLSLSLSAASSLSFPP